jgi:hypothetical protein
VKEGHEEDGFYESDIGSDYDSSSDSNSSEDAGRARLSNNTAFTNQEESASAALNTSDGQVLGFPSSLLFTAEMSGDAEAAFFSYAIEAPPPRTLFRLITHQVVKH